MEKNKPIVKHPDTFNFESYNRDVIKSVDEHNKRIDEKEEKYFSDEAEYRARHITRFLGKKSVFINWKEGQYEEVFKKNA